MNVIFPFYARPCIISEKYFHSTLSGHFPKDLVQLVKLMTTSRRKGGIMLGTRQLKGSQVAANDAGADQFVIKKAKKMVEERSE